MRWWQIFVFALIGFLPSYILSRKNSSFKKPKESNNSFTFILIIVMLLLLLITLIVFGSLHLQYGNALPVEPYPTTYPTVSPVPYEEKIIEIEKNIEMLEDLINKLDDKMDIIIDDNSSIITTSSLLVTVIGSFLGVMFDKIWEFLSPLILNIQSRIKRKGKK